jgi:YfiH family protein
VSGNAAAILRADWPAPPGVQAFTTLRSGAGVSQPPFDQFNLGMRTGDDPEAVARNRAELIARFALPSPPRWLRQVHGTRVARFTHPLPNPPPQAGEGADVEFPQAGEGADVEFPQSGEGAGFDFPHANGEAGMSRAQRLPPLAGEGWDGGETEADAATTRLSGTVLAILTADCLPVVFAANDGSEVGAAHAGWRGLAGGVLEATIAAMQAAPENIIAWLGPAAGPQAYEVGEEVFDAFVSRDPRVESAFATTRPGHWRVDLYALARQRLADAGVARVHGGGLCTISDPQRFFSHRRDQRGGRMATLAWLSP